MELKSVAEVAEMLGTSTQTVHRWINENRIIGVMRIGHAIAVPTPLRILSDFPTAHLEALVPVEEWGDYDVGKKPVAVRRGRPPRESTMAG